MWSFGWSPQEAMNYFQEEMTHFFDATVVFKFFCMKFTTFYTCTPLHTLSLPGLLKTLLSCPSAGVLVYALVTS